MKQKIIKYVLIINGIICLLFYIAAILQVKTDFLLNDKIEADAKSGVFGDLYFMNFIKHFKTELPPVNNEQKSDFNRSALLNSDILVFGDSFFYGSRGIPAFPRLLADKLKCKIVNFDNNGPYYLLNKISDPDFKKDLSGKILILEIAERFVAASFNSKYFLRTRLESYSESVYKIFHNPKIESTFLYLIKRGKFVSTIYSGISNFDYNTFGITNELSPYYADNPPWQFYYQETNNDISSFYYNFSDNEINVICDNIKVLSDRLKYEYNLNFIFIPIPNKYTICHKYFNNDRYNNLLPRIYQELSIRNVNFADFYKPFMKSSDTLYYPTDTHWNDKGISIGLETFLDKFNDLITPPHIR